MKFFPLVWAALLRKPAEAVLTFLAITAAFTLLSLMIGLNLTTQQILNRTRMDRLWVDPRFPDEPGLPLALTGQIARIDGVTGVGAYHWLGGYHVDPHQHVGIVMMDEGMRVAWSEGSLTPRQWDELSERPSGIFASVKAAAKWGLKEGDDFTVVTGPKSRNDGGTSWDFQVLGVVPDYWDWSQPQSGFIVGNATYLENTEPLDQRGIGYGINVALSSAARAVSISEQIDRQYENSGTATVSIPKRLDAQTEIQRGFAMASMTAGIAVAGFVMILFLTGNAIARSVRERIPEFAVLETIGFRDVHLMSLVFTDAVIPCLLGAAVGTGLAGVVDRLSTRFLPESLSQFLTAPAPTFALLAWALGLAVLLALASSVIPIMRLRRLSVTDALAGR